MTTWQLSHCYTSDVCNFVTTRCEVRIHFRGKKTQKIMKIQPFCNLQFFFLSSEDLTAFMFAFLGASETSVSTIPSFPTSRRKILPEKLSLTLGKLFFSILALRATSRFIARTELYYYFKIKSTIYGIDKCCLGNHLLCIGRTFLTVPMTLN